MSEPVTLDEASVEAIAQRVVELQQDQQAPHLVDAKELARMMGVSRDVVYAAKYELGAVRIGKPGSKRPRYMFDPSRALRPPDTAPAPAPSARTKRPSASEPSDVRLLSIKGD
jgi:hypothetical protein